MNLLNIKLSGIVNSMGNPNTIKPGALLRALREQQNLTVEDISEKTLISLGKLKLLEEDRYNDVGIDLFVCGYIKKYAYIVGADSDQLIADFKSLNNVPTDDALSTDTAVDGAALRNRVEDDAKITDKSYVKMDGRSEDIIYTGDKTNPLAKIIPMVFVVLVLIAIWGAISFFMRDDVPPNMDVSDEEVIETRSDETGVAKDSELTLDDSVASNIADSTVADSTVADSSDVDVVELPLSESEGVSSLVDVAPLTSTPDTMAPALALVSDSASTVNTAQSDLVFSFSDDCWVSVKDANGESLFAQLQGSGDNLQLSGIAPFDIQLGNARVASLRVNDQPYSIPVKSGRKTLRFTVTP